MKNKLFGLMLTYGAALHAQQLVEVDRTILSRALQREYLAAVQSRNQPPEAMKRMAAALTSREPVESRRMLLESVAGVKGIQWTAAHAEASAFGVGIGETVVEPKSNIHAVVERIYPAAPVEGV
ncbi:MAG: hypothetical protein MUC42_14165, partial [Bryobacter sp.]|nr:hypothetical protein [Bryobacter sp.]